MYIQLIIFNSCLLDTITSIYYCFCIFIINYTMYHKGRLARGTMLRIIPNGESWILSHFGRFLRRRCLLVNNLMSCISEKYHKKIKESKGPLSLETHQIIPRAFNLKKKQQPKTRETHSKQISILTQLVC